MSPFRGCSCAITLLSSADNEGSLPPRLSLVTASRKRLCNKLGLRHEETCQSARSRQHRSMIVDKQIDFFWLIVSMGHSLGSQIEPVGRPGPHKAAKSTQQGCQEQADRAIRGQMDPARAPGAARSSQLRPDRASQGGPGRLAGRPADCANASWTPVGRPDTPDRTAGRQTEATRTGPVAAKELLTPARLQAR